MVEVRAVWGVWQARPGRSEDGHSFKRDRCWVGERGLLASIVSDVAVLSSYPTLISSKYGVNPGPVTLVVLPPQLEFPSML